MAEQKDIECLIRLMHEAHPHESLKKMDRTSEGLGAVLHYLARQDQPVTSGQIAQAMQVSTARIAVILKKLEGKKLIVREPGINDARTTVVYLSPRGESTVAQMRDDIYQLLGTLIDQIGLSRMTEFALISKEIHAVIKGLEPPKDPFEDD